MLLLASVAGGGYLAAATHTGPGPPYDAMTDIRNRAASWTCPTKNDSQLPTAAWLSVERCALTTAWSTISNQRLEHTGEPRGEPFGADTLGGDAGTFAYQEDFVRETLGIGEPGITAQAE